MKKMTGPLLTLSAQTAADLMTPNPVSIRDEATVQEAVALLTDKKISAAPVIDKAGRPVGVLSRADLVVHVRETVNYLEPVPEYYEHGEGERKFPEGNCLGKADYARVRDIMTPVVFAVTPQTPAAQVVEDLLARKVHRLFVVSGDGVLTGVISTLDILRHLTPE